MQHVAIWRILTNIKVWQSIRANHRSHCRWLRIHHASCQSFCGQDTVWITHLVSSRILWALLSRTISCLVAIQQVYLFGKYYYVYQYEKVSWQIGKSKMDFDFLPVVPRFQPQMLKQVLWFRRPKTGVAGASSRAQKYLEIGLTFLQKYLCPDLP